MSVFDGAACAAALKKIAAGDMSGVEFIYERLGRQIYTLALSMLGSETEAEDVMQETFIKIMNSAGSYSESAGSARTWILSITRNIALNRLKRRRIISFGELSENIPDDDAGIEEADEAGRIMRVLDGTERQIVVLRAVQRLRWKEIARIIGRSEDHTRKKYAKAIEKMRNGGGETK